MKIAAISDVHNKWASVEVKSADILLVAGDITADGDPYEFEIFFDFLKKIKFTYEGIAIIAGNHDGPLFERRGNGREWFRTRLREIVGDKAVYLEHEVAEVCGKKIFGSPYVKMFCQLGFNRTDSELRSLWEHIPNDTEILLTHTPPKGILDGVWRRNLRNFKTVQELESTGCFELRKRIEQLNKLQAHVFGHIHEWGGQCFMDEDHIAVNACHVGSYQNPASRGMTVFEIR